MLNFNSFPPIIQKLLKLDSKNEDSVLSFEASKDGVNKNFNTLKEFEFDLDKVLNLEKNHITAYGSEFEDTSILKICYSIIPDGNYVRKI